MMYRILIVDDDADLRSLVRRMLSPTGFEIEEAADGREGIGKFRAQPADLVLCDMFMAEKDGLEVLKDLRRECPGVKVVVMSGGGRSGINLLSTASFLGAAKVLQKPFQQAQLLKIVGELLPVNLD